MNMIIIQKITQLIACHMLGDYVLQTPFIANSKGQNLYHLFVHCVLYCLPFVIVFGFTWQIGVLFIAHMIVDPLKAKFLVINYPVDQIIHYLTMAVYFM